MKIISITNSKLIDGNIEDFYVQIEKIAKAKPTKIIIREKELLEQDVFEISKRCLEICKKYDVEIAINKFIEIAKKLEIKNLHLSLPDFKDNYGDLDFFDCVGVSIHSLDEALLAEKLGANYLIAGHIFMTDCKKGVLPRGISFLKEICEKVNIPVFAIGGIDLSNVSEINKTKAEGICLMSSLMKDKEPSLLIQKLKTKVIQ